MVLLLSEGMRKEMEQFHPKRALCLPIPIDLKAFFELRPHQRNASLSPVLLYVGQVKKIKGIDILIEALALLRKEGTRAKLLIAGGATSRQDEEFFQELKEKARGLDVEFLGWVEHEKLPEFYERADIFVLPSLSEAWGMVVAEAMAAGLPVVASDVSGPRDLVAEGETGYLMQAGNPEALKEKLSTLLRDSRLRESMGLAGRERVKRYMREAFEANQTFWSTL